MLNFEDCTLVKLDKTFRMEQIQSDAALELWLRRPVELSAFERESLLTFQEELALNVHDWNETELAYNFIGPLMALAKYTTRHSNFFAERLFSGIVDGIEMGGRPDGMIASGVREPETPYFCFQEYKRETDPEGDPAAQALAAMLVAQELNAHRHRELLVVYDAARARVLHQPAVCRYPRRRVRYFSHFESLKIDCRGIDRTTPDCDLRIIDRNGVSWRRFLPGIPARSAIFARAAGYARRCVESLFQGC